MTKPWSPPIAPHQPVGVTTTILVCFGEGLTRQGASALFKQHCCKVGVRLATIRHEGKAHFYAWVYTTDPDERCRISHPNEQPGDDFEQLLIVDLTPSP